MGQPGLIAMSMRELDRLKVVEAVIEQRLMPWRAAERLGISRRHIERLVARYRAAGAAGLAFVTSVVNWLSKSADTKMQQIEARTLVPVSGTASFEYAFPSF